MAQIHILIHAEAMHEVVRQHVAVRILRLPNNGHGARIVQEDVVHRRGPPRRDAVATTETLVADQRVAAAVEVAGGVVCAEVVFLLVGEKGQVSAGCGYSRKGEGDKTGAYGWDSYLGPVDLEVGEADVFEASEYSEHVWVFV
jgi:hypothetical protein